MSQPIRVLLVDDDALVRAALTMMLDGADGIVVVGDASDGDEVPAAVDRLHPHVVLMDLRMPRVSGIVATQRLRARPGAPEVIVLTTFDTDENVLRALRAGASGFLLKDSSPAKISDAIRAVTEGEPMLSPNITRRLIEHAVTEAGSFERARRKLESLTPREREVANAIAQGKPNSAIAAELYMSVATVKAHTSRLLTKLNLGNRTQIALLVHDCGEG